MAREVHMPISLKRLGFKATAQLSLMPVRNVHVHPFLILSPSTLVVSLCALKSGIIFYKVHKLRGSQRDLLTRPEPQPPGDGVLISEVRRGAVSPVHLS